MITQIHCEGEAYRDEVVALDNRHFKRCTFLRCTLTYGANGPVSLVNCDLKDSYLEFIGPAGNTMAMVATMLRPQSGLREMMLEALRIGPQDLPQPAAKPGRGFLRLLRGRRP